MLNFLVFCWAFIRTLWLRKYGDGLYDLLDLSLKVNEVLITVHLEVDRIVTVCVTISQDLFFLLQFEVSIGRILRCEILWVSHEVRVFSQYFLVGRSVVEVILLFDLNRFVWNELGSHVRRPKVGRGLHLSTESFLQLTRVVKGRKVFVGSVAGEDKFRSCFRIQKLGDELRTHHLRPRRIEVEASVQDEHHVVVANFCESLDHVARDCPHARVAHIRYGVPVVGLPRE